MPPSPPIDLVTAHRWFSADFFNRTWGYLDKADRTCEDDQAMLSLAHASLAHWLQREDATPQNLSVGHWLLSRVYAVLELGEPAHRYGVLSLRNAEGEPAFYRAYAHEAIARAARVGGNEEPFREHLEKAKALLPEISDPEERALLEPDLAGLES